ncbi:MAG: hypothetical protein AAGU21_06655 [Solidesulfovibrio sp.]|uniref:hypothetical protein n=1 Tax=Solidesulfovibrio sp. TaxID=2910990 RepID=UPI002B2126FC|nr:hypothetical protein [Solidesulfovibrio sp.]MEA4856853.1 hypothetical protein [Solidesulfovibrio sp.]
MTQGRPKSVRVGDTGDKLYMALKLTGMCWGTRVGPNHIAVNPRWAQCGLPRSINTVIEDIRSGIPVHRLERYAGFFQVPADLFADTAIGPYSATFSCEILKNKHRFSPAAALEASLLDRQASRHVREHNGVAANYPLYQLLCGVYALYYKRCASDVLYNGVVQAVIQAEVGMSVDAVIVIDGIPVEISGTLFRWNNALHVQYRSDDFQVLGYLIGPNPMDSILLRRRNPFFLKLHGLAGNLELTAEPDRYEACVVKQAPAEGQGLAQAFEALLDRAVRGKSLSPGDGGYAAAAALFAAPAG